MVTGKTERRALAQLGLVVFAYGVSIAPVIHAVVGHGVQHADEPQAAAWIDHGRSAEEEHHSHGHRHSPSGAPHSHHPDGLEHLSASLLAPRLVPWKPAVVQLMERVALSTERPRAGEGHRLPAMPQGP